MRAQWEMKSIPFQKQAIMQISGRTHLFRLYAFKAAKLSIADLSASAVTLLPRLLKKGDPPTLALELVKGMLGYFVSLSMLLSILGFCLLF